MFGKDPCYRLAFCLLTTTLISCTLVASHVTVAPNASVDDVGSIDDSENIHVRATPNTFMLAHVIDPATAGFPFKKAADWLTFFQERTEAYAASYKYEHKGQNPPTALNRKSINTMAISTSTKIRGDFKKAKKNSKYSWSNSKYRIFVYTSNDGASPIFRECPIELYVLALVYTSDSQPFHLQGVCDTRPDRGQNCYPSSNCNEIYYQNETELSYKFSLT